MMKAIETTGKVNKNGQLLLDEALDISPNSEVKVIVLVSEQPESDPDDTPVEEIKVSLRRALQEVKEGKTMPISDLWEGIDVE